MTAPGTAETKDVHSLIFDMEHPIGEAFRFGNALALAIEGIGKTCHMEQEDQASALRALAFEVCGATEKLREQWKELFELSNRERRG
jgi:hypothetical protein